MCVYPKYIILLNSKMLIESSYRQTLGNFLDAYVYKNLLNIDILHMNTYEKAFYLIQKQPQFPLNNRITRILSYFIRKEVI